MSDDYAGLSNAQAVAANRAGALTEEQRARLTQRTRGSGACAVVFLVVFGAAFLVPALLSTGVFSGSGFSAVGSLICASPVLAIGIGILALGLYAPFGIRRQQRQITRELAAGGVARGEGWVAYTPRGYIARMEWAQAIPGTGAARWRRGRRVNLPPGRYYFYYLPQSGTLLSAELVGGQAAREAGVEASVFSAPSAPAPDPLAGLPGYTPTPQAFGGYGASSGAASGQSVPPGAVGTVLLALAEAHHFSMEDLAENRLGRLAPGQTHRTGGPAWLFIPFALAFFACGIFMALVTVAQGKFFFVTAPFAVAFIGISAIIVTQLFRRRADTRVRRVEVVEGVVTGDVDSSDEITSYYYTVATMRFQVSGRGYYALIAGMRYRLYYIPRANQLVSIEPIGA